MLKEKGGMEERMSVARAVQRAFKMREMNFFGGGKSLNSRHIPKEAGVVGREGKKRLALENHALHSQKRKGKRQVPVG